MRRGAVPETATAALTRAYRMHDETLPPLIETRPGLYRHYKNLMYEVLGTVRHSETLVIQLHNNC